MAASYSPLSYAAYASAANCSSDEQETINTAIIEIAITIFMILL
jgi:hypothetical protein